LFPVSDASLSVILKRREELESQVRIPFAGYSAYRSLSDKFSLLRLAQQLRIPIPPTAFVESEEDVERAIGTIEYPAVIKSGKCLIKDGRTLVKPDVEFVNSPGEALRYFACNPHLAKNAIIQTRIRGIGAGVFLLYDEGRLVAEFAHRRIREKPPWGGVSVLSESVSMDPTLKQYATQLLEHVGWHGPAMVEFRIDLQTGKPYLLEVNGRFWGSLQLAIWAGVDFPFLLYRLAKGETIKPVHRYQTGVQCRWLWGDLDHLLILCRSQRDLKSTSSGTKCQAIAQFLSSYFNHPRFDVFSLEDPEPWLFESWHHLQGQS